MPREVYCLQRVGLQHVDNVAALLDYYYDGRHSSYILVMERLERGQDLFDYITLRGRLNEPEARYLMSQILDTVIQLDDAGIVHRDIKDENIVVDVDSKQVRLVDFGSASPVSARPFTQLDGSQTLHIRFRSHRINLNEEKRKI